MTSGPAGQQEPSEVRRLRELGRALTHTVDVDVLDEGATRVRLLGEGMAGIAEGMQRLEPVARASVWNMQPTMSFDPEDPAFELNDSSRARGVDLRLVTTVSTSRVHPLLGSMYPVTRIGPVFTRAMIVDERLAVVGGPRSATGSLTAWTSTDPGIVGQLLEIWELCVRLSQPLVTEDTPLLDHRQLQVARLLALGQTDQAMARRLGISVRTVEREVRAVLGFLGARSRTEAVLEMRGRGVNGGRQV